MADQALLCLEVITDEKGLTTGVGGAIVRELGHGSYWANDLPKLRPIDLTPEDRKKLQRPAIVVEDA